MKNLYLALLMIIGASTASFSQLPNGSTAPDFTLTDRDGVEHNLYSYLNQGKVVFLDFFGCHCPGCWARHTGGQVQDLYAQYGPDGTDQIMVLMIEYDQNNPEAFSGGGTYTQGDWETGNIIPMIDVEDPVEREIFTDYNLMYFHLLKVCTDKTVKLMNSSATTAELFQEANACAGNLSIGSNNLEGTVFYNALSKQLLYQGYEQVTNISVFNLAGQNVINLNGDFNGLIDVSALTESMYVVQIEHSTGVTSKKIMIQ